VSAQQPAQQRLLTSNKPLEATAGACIDSYLFHLFRI